MKNINEVLAKLSGEISSVHIQEAVLEKELELLRERVQVLLTLKDDLEKLNEFKIIGSK